MNRKTNNNIVIYAKELADLTKTPKITYILERDLRILIILSILSVLINFTILKGPVFPLLPTIAVSTISKIDNNTIPPSSQFILSSTYFLTPIAMSFTDISTINR